MEICENNRSSLELWTPVNSRRSRRSEGNQWDFMHFILMWTRVIVQKSCYKDAYKILPSVEWAAMMEDLRSRCINYLDKWFFRIWNIPREGSVVFLRLLLSKSGHYRSFTYDDFERIMRAYTKCQLCLVSKKLTYGHPSLLRLIEQFIPFNFPKIRTNCDNYYCDNCLQHKACPCAIQNNREVQLPQNLFYGNEVNGLYQSIWQREWENWYEEQKIEDEIEKIQQNLWIRNCRWKSIQN